MPFRMIKCIGCGEYSYILRAVSISSKWMDVMKENNFIECHWNHNKPCVAIWHIVYILFVRHILWDTVNRVSVGLQQVKWLIIGSMRQKTNFQAYIECTQSWFLNRPRLLNVCICTMWGNDCHSGKYLTLEYTFKFGCVLRFSFRLLNLF